MSNASTRNPPATSGDQPVWFVNSLTRVQLDAADSDGTLDVVESRGRQDDMPPLHLHRREDEYFVVLDGELSLHLPGQSRRVTAGQTAYAPKGVPHTYRVESEQARWLTISCPSGFASFVRAVADPAESESVPPADRPIDLARMEAAAAAHEIELLGPPGTLP